MKVEHACMPLPLNINYLLLQNKWYEVARGRIWFNILFDKLSMKKSCETTQH